MVCTQCVKLCRCVFAHLIIVVVSSSSTKETFSRSPSAAYTPLLLHTQPLSALEQWHGSCPLVASVVADLEGLGYCSWAQRVVGSAGFGSPLSVRRVLVVASRYGDARDVLLAQVWLGGGVEGWVWLGVGDDC